MRSRNIKPGFFKNEILAECDPLTRILFLGLWCYADRRGICEYRPKRIKAEILPYDDVDVEQMLEQLKAMGFIDTWKAVITTPSNFYENMQKTGEWTENTELYRTLIMPIISSCYEKTQARGPLSKIACFTLTR